MYAVVFEAPINSVQIKPKLILFIAGTSNQALREVSVKRTWWIENDIVLRILRYVEVRDPCLDIKAFGQIRPPITVIGIHTSRRELSFRIQRLRNAWAGAEISSVLQACPKSPLLSAQFESSIYLVDTCIDWAGGQRR